MGIAVALLVMKSCGGTMHMANKALGGTVGPIQKQQKKKNHHNTN
jgi:hypothetical protein